MHLPKELKRFTKLTGAHSLRATIAALGVVTLLTATYGQTAHAEQKSNSTSSLSQTAADPNAIPLRAPVKNAPPEQWENVDAHIRNIRNVVNPTLTPYLPDPAKATGAGVIIAPGGAFYLLSIDTEGYQVAKWLTDHGVAAFVLKYRVQKTPRDEAGFRKLLQERMSNAVSSDKVMGTPAEALDDAEAAVRLVRERSKEWGIDPKRVGFVGFSAGAMTTLSVGLVADDASRPNFIAPIYPPMMARTVPAYAPPMFVAIALDDDLFARNKNLGLIDSWRNAHRPLEVHLYGRGGHGFGMVGTSAADMLWIDEFYAWMKDSGFIGNAFMRSGDTAYSVEKTNIGTLLDNPDTRAILVKYLPQIANSSHVDLMRSQTLINIRAYAKSIITDEKLNAIQAELQKLPAKK